jgi:hypothetical protein
MSRPSNLTNGRELQLLTSEDGCVLLDVDNDRVLKLNSVAAEMWTLLDGGETEPQIAATLSKKYNVNEDRVFQDVTALVKRIAELKIAGRPISSSTPQQATENGSIGSSFPWYGQVSIDNQPTPTTRMVLTAFLGLAVFDVILSLFSLKSLCCCVRRCPVKRSRCAGTSVIGPVCVAVHRACVWYPKRTLCLQRSAVTSCLLRAHGISARMVIGVRPMPFLAHAWVEADGAVVNDWPKVRTFYHSLLSQ